MPNKSYVFGFLDFSNKINIDYLKKQNTIFKDSKHSPNKFIESIKTCPDLHDDFPYFFYIMHQAKIIASVKGIPDILFAQETNFKWAWMGDLYTNPHFRGQGIASILWENMLDIYQKRNYFVAGTFANAISAHICRKMGFTFTDKAHRLMFLKKINKFLKPYSRITLLNYFIDYFYRAIVYASKPLVHRDVPHNYKNYEIIKIDFSNLQDLNIFNTLKYNIPFHFNDGKSKVFWKLNSANDFSSYIVIESISKKPILYLILKYRKIKHMFAGRFTNFKLMTLMDFGMKSGTKFELELLIQILLSEFWKSDAEALEIVTSLPVLIHKLYRKGFFKAGQGIEFFFKPPNKLEQQFLSRKIEHWHFTHFVADGYSFL